MNTDKSPLVPPHPGFVLKRDYIDPIRVSVTDLASKLGVSRNTLSSIINGRAGITADMALRLSRAFKTSPDIWLKLMNAYELYVAELVDSGWKDVEPVKPSKPKAPAPPKAPKAAS
jgi:addiction module HigA family antidote